MHPPTFAAVFAKPDPLFVLSTAVAFALKNLLLYIVNIFKYELH